MNLQAVGPRHKAGGGGVGAALGAGINRGADFHRVAPWVIQPGVRAGAGQEGVAALRVSAVEPLQLPQTWTPTFLAARVAAVTLVPAAAAAVLGRDVVAAGQHHLVNEGHFPIL